MLDLSNLVIGWTHAKTKAFIVSALRSSFRRWPPKQQCINGAYIETKINTATGRMAKHYRCAECQGSFPRTMVEANHIIPVVDPTVGFKDWNTWIERAFVAADGFNCLCKPCHKKFTAEERKKKTK